MRRNQIPTCALKFVSRQSINYAILCVHCTAQFDTASIQTAAQPIIANNIIHMIASYSSRSRYCILIWILILLTVNNVTMGNAIALFISIVYVCDEQTVEIY